MCCFPLASRGFADINESTCKELHSFRSCFLSLSLSFFPHLPLPSAPIFIKPPARRRETPKSKGPSPRPVAPGRPFEGFVPLGSCGLGSWTSLGWCGQSPKKLKDCQAPIVHICSTVPPVGDESHLFLFTLPENMMQKVSPSAESAMNSYSRTTTTGVIVHKGPTA